MGSPNTRSIWPGSLLAVILLAWAASDAMAADADPLQDFCVALPSPQNPVINGLVCKDPMQVVAADFTSVVLRNAGDAENQLGSKVTLASALNFSALNTQGLSMARIDFASKGLNPPHVHPRATEVLFVAEGTLYVGFVDTNQNLFAQTLYTGDLFVFPRGLVHFQLNVGKESAVAIAALNSQNPGTSQVAKALFAASPPLPEEVLEIAFGINEKEVYRLIEGVKKTL